MSDKVLYQHVGKLYEHPDGTLQTYMTIAVMFKERNIFERLWFALMYVLFPLRRKNAAKMTVILLGESDPPNTYKTDAEDTLVH